MRQRPLSIWAAFALIMAALVITSGRTLYDVYDMAKTRDDVAMSGVWADAVWCNVAIWVALGLPLYGAMRGWKFASWVLAAISLLLIVLLILLMRSGNHTLNIWLFLILGLQIGGTILFFVTPSRTFFRPRTV